MTEHTKTVLQQLIQVLKMWPNQELYDIKELEKLYETLN